MGSTVPPFPKLTAHTGLTTLSLSDLGSVAYSSVWIPPIKTNRVIKCEYCKSQNYFEYKEFNCKQCGAPLKLECST